MFTKKRYEVHLSDDALTYNGVTYPLREIKHIDFVWIKTTQRMNFVKVGEPEEAIMDVIMDSDKKVNIQIDESTIFMGWNRDRKNEIATMKEIYAELMQRTVQARLAKYLEFQRRTGYFDYLEWHLTPPDSFSHKGKSYRVSDYQLMKGPNYISFEKKNKSAMDRLGALWSVPAFATVRDRDILFFLLKQNFGLTWK